MTDLPPHCNFCGYRAHESDLEDTRCPACGQRNPWTGVIRIRGGGGKRGMWMSTDQRLEFYLGG